LAPPGVPRTEYGTCSVHSRWLGLLPMLQWRHAPPGGSTEPPWPCQQLDWEKGPKSYRERGNNHPKSTLWVGCGMGGATLLKSGGGFTGVCCLNSKSYPYFVDVILNLFDSIFFFLIKVDL